MEEEETDGHHLFKVDKFSISDLESILISRTRKGVQEAISFTSWTRRITVFWLLSLKDIGRKSNRFFPLENIPSFKESQECRKTHHVFCSNRVQIVTIEVCLLIPEKQVFKSKDSLG